MKKVLLVYYSRTGFTRRVAEEIAKRLDCDVCELQEEHPRAGIVGYLRSAFEAYTGHLPALREPEYELGKYGLSIVGSPVWAGRVCAPIRAFLASQPLGPGEIAVFVTYGGMGASKVLDSLTALAGKAAVARLALTDREIDADAMAHKVDAFVAAVRAKGST